MNAIMSKLGLLGPGAWPPTPLQRMKLQRSGRVYGHIGIPTLGDFTAPPSMLHARELFHTVHSGNRNIAPGFIVALGVV